MKATTLGVTMAVAMLFLAVGDIVGDTPDTAAKNKDIIRECNRLANIGDLKGQNACFADEIMFQGHAVKRDSLLANLEDIHATFPDSHSEIVGIIAEGDTVVTRNRVSGTHRGVAQRAVNGGMLVGVPPTGKRFEVQNIRWYKLRDGKIVEHYAARDDIGMMRQLGLLPAR